jgi:hypothetical protein
VRDQTQKLDLCRGSEALADGDHKAESQVRGNLPQRITGDKDEADKQEASGHSETELSALREQIYENALRTASYDLAQSRQSWDGRPPRREEEAIAAFFDWNEGHPTAT